MVVLAKYTDRYGGQQAFANRILDEWDARITPFSPTYRENHPLQSIYVGGGTPSLLPASFYQQWFKRIQADWPWAPQAEITLEANPNAWEDDPQAYRDVGFNRVSIGIQSLNDEELKALSRIHTEVEAKRCVEVCRDAGFNNISVDVMVGIPKQHTESWQHTINGLIQLNVEHISMYGLQVEPATPLHRLVQMGAYALPDDKHHVSLKRQGLHALEWAGYRAYEFSNLAKPGYESRHNQNYWRQGDYLALGPGAHGYVHPERYANSREMAQWMADPVGSSSSHTVSDEERLQNVMIFGLRETGGIDRQAAKQCWGVDVLDQFAPEIGKWVERGALLWEQDMQRLRLHPDWVAVSNTVLADFIS